MSQQLVRSVAAEGNGIAERERRLRLAGSSRPQSIDSVPFRGRFRRSVLRLGQGIRGAAARA